MNFLNDKLCINRLVDEYYKYKQLIIAVDYDNTLYDYHHKGYDFTETIELIRECNRMGFCIIIYTCSGEERYPEIKKYLTANDIPFNYINENSPNITFAKNKLYYNIFLDDRCGIKSASKQLKKAIKIIKKGAN